MKAVGFLAGAGSLLHECRAAGLRVVGNMDPRPYYRTAPWVWPANFSEPFVGKVENIDQECRDDWHGADIALGHPPCGTFSVLGNSAARVERFTTDESRAEWHQARRKNTGLLPLFINLVTKFKPKVFALDNLPKMMKAFGEEQWNEALPEYRITYIVMTNFDYGSCQVRKRLWVIGTLGKKRFRFRPPEGRLPGPKTAWEAISDLPWQPWEDIPELDHVHHLIQSKPIGGYWARSADGERFAIDDMMRYAAGFLRLPPGGLWTYQNNHGRYTHKPARARLILTRPSRTLSGNETLNHPFTAWPLTVRERARIMGWPDDFKLGDGRLLDRKAITALVRVTGRAVPSEFPRYLIPQLIEHVRKRKL